MFYHRQGWQSGPQIWSCFYVHDNALRHSPLWVCQHLSSPSIELHRNNIMNFIHKRSNSTWWRRVGQVGVWGDVVCCWLLESHYQCYRSGCLHHSLHSLQLSPANFYGSLCVSVNQVISRHLPLTRPTHTLTTHPPTHISAVSEWVSEWARCACIITRVTSACMAAKRTAAKRTAAKRKRSASNSQSDVDYLNRADLLWYVTFLVN